MNEAQLDAFLADCTQALKARHDDLEARFGLAAMTRWQFDDHEGTLTFFRDGRAVLCFDVTPIGTLSTTQDTWKWAWANDKLHSPLRQRAEPLRALRAHTDFDCFGDPEPFPADEVMAWELAAAAVAELGALGCYRAPNRETWLFLALDALRPA